MGICIVSIFWIKNAAMEIGVQVFLWTYVFICLRYISVSGTGSQMVTMLNFLRCGHTVFPNGCTISHSHWYCIHVLDFSTFLPRIVAFDFLMIATLVSVKWHFTVVVICISLMTVGHFLCA